LELINIHKYFGSVKALHGINLRIYPSEIFGLIGENDVGKSEIAKAIFRIMKTR